MALITAQQILITGNLPTLATPSASDTVAPGDRTFLWVKTGGTGTTVTVVVPGTTFGQANPDVPVVIGTSTERLIGPLVPALADPATGLVTVTYSSTATVTAAAVSV